MQKEFITAFIDVYRLHPALWKVKSSEYANRNLKNLGYLELEEVCKQFNIKCDRELVKKKIQSLRGAFRKELRKVENSMKSGCTFDEIYKPNLWYFNSLLFLKEQEQPSNSHCNEVSPSSSISEEDREVDDVKIEIKQEQDSDFYITDESQVTSPQPYVSQSNVSTSVGTQEWQKRKRLKRAKSNEHLEFLQACTNAIKSSNKEELLDASGAFGLYVEKRLKSIKIESQKLYAETLITQVLQRAVLGTLTSNTSLSNPDTHS